MVYTQESCIAFTLGPLAHASKDKPITVVNGQTGGALNKVSYLPHLAFGAFQFMPALPIPVPAFLVSALAALPLLLAAAPSLANMELAKAKNCTVCHAIDKKIIGPSYQEVAVKYAKDKDAVARLKEKVLKGGVGTWGQVPMPANTLVNAAEAETLVKWILATKK
jgi:cytochrome c